MEAEIYTPDPVMVAAIARRLAEGEHFISRIRTSRFFLVVDGDFEDAVVGDEVRSAVTALAGVELEEFVPRQYPGEHGLRFPPRLRARAKRSIAQSLATEGQKGPLSEESERADVPNSEEVGSNIEPSVAAPDCSPAPAPAKNE
ncbi:hypothetical protein [Piscinibacter gummiphilus]|uniref:Uncharacterized protein n=1 Tax=Piscinibacter gummiphilus TaxID=946333 RepID=A0ABZ0D214_9BURK|nr:hypothetical protein [Piscinibacter gummiphilus]WOB11287.1 hypothetical protein RXV79_27020 [Piscinibacter gummiphilus]